MPEPYIDFGDKIPGRGYLKILIKPLNFFKTSELQWSEFVNVYLIRV